MTHHRYLSIIAAAGIFSWIAWVVVIHRMDPKIGLTQINGLSLGLFYLSLFFALACTFTVLGFYFRVWLNKNEIYYQHIHIAFRQGVMLTLIALGCLTFQVLGILTWWSGLLLIASITLVEFYFMARQKEY